MKIFKLSLGATVFCSTLAAVKVSSRNDGADENELQLRHVQVIFRHGARTPLHVPNYAKGATYEESLMNHDRRTIVPFQIISLQGKDLDHSPFEEAYRKRGRLDGGCFPGQLTHLGADQMYQLGLILKGRYVDSGFLSPSSVQRMNEIYSRSTNIERTILSARCVLAGLFSDEKMVQALKIHVSDPSAEIMYPNYYSCSQLASLTRWAWHDPDKLPGLKNIRRTIQERLKVSESEKLHLVDVFDNLITAGTHGKVTLDLTKQLVKQVEEAALDIMHGAFVGVEAVKKTSLQLAIGSFVDLLMKIMEEKSTKEENGDPVKMHLYSGHDTTIIPLLCALNIEVARWPPYASNIILELYESKASSSDKPAQYAQVLFNGKVQLIEGCSSTMCPFDEFQKAVAKFRIPEDQYRKICDLKPEGNLVIPQD